ncbi:MAG: hypothetical protein U0Q18_25360 [Bryobacteraceae bacterium]
MPHLPYHPAPGLGEFAPGWFVVPQNPIRAAMKSSPGSPIAVSDTGLVPTFGAPRYRPRFGELVAAKFVVPQNPIRAALGACGCAGSCGRGMGALDFNVSDIISGNAGIETYLVLGGLAFAAFWLLGGQKKYHAGVAGRSERRSRVEAAKAAYYRTLTS